MEQFTTPMPLPQRQTRLGGSGEALAVQATAEEPTHAELLDVIHGARAALEGKIETVAEEVNLLRADPSKVSDKRFLDVKAKLRVMNIMLLYTARLKVISGGRLQLFEHPEEVWRWLEMCDKVGPGPSGRSGVGSARTSGVDGTDWRKHGDALTWVSAQHCDDSVSRIEIQQDGTMVVVDPEQAVELADSSDVEAWVLSVDY
ncbi:hypothetical protein NDU88_000410 [Pleurodeles waltl]|uniref:Uncharacterized protein n=1 Tax=Pleurodeles waltl TaxID=8319 RepID=A0AAV7U719_PLEWA|nr:hypothetical protein NDU88_000410 [Pleurodeles waltl]